MTPETVKDTYRRMIEDGGEPVLLRRYTGSGITKPRFDAQVRAKVVGYDPEELVGGIIQGDRKVIVLAQDIIDRQFALPLTTSDKVVVRGSELAIIKPDDSTRRISGVLVAYELQARG